MASLVGDGGGRLGKVLLETNREARGHAWWAGDRELRTRLVLGLVGLVALALCSARVDASLGSEDAVGDRLTRG